MRPFFVYDIDSSSFRRNGVAEKSKMSIFTIKNAKVKFYFIYIITNINKTVLYIGVTGDIKRRLNEHLIGEIPGFSQKYNCKYLIYYEKYESPSHAISREKQLKKWSRSKKDLLITERNPDLKFLNDRVFKVDDMYL